MRNVKRIFRLMTLIFKIWIKYPDLRLFQLLANPFTPKNFLKEPVFTDRDYYYVEDNDLEKRLREHYKMGGDDKCSE